jgi:hypothetical protein
MQSDWRYSTDCGRIEQVGFVLSRTSTAIFGNAMACRRDNPKADGERQECGRSGEWRN